MARPKFAGISVEPGQFRDLHTLIAECAAAAGIAAPERVYLSPDMTAAAYSGGKLSLSRQSQTDSVFIGTGALLLLPRSDLKGILLHEFAHIALRRRVVSVNICNKIYDFIPRFRRAHRHAWAAIVTIAPSIVFALLWWAFRKSMHKLSRQEELLVDRCAANVTSEHHYAGALTRYAMVHMAMQMQGRDAPALLTAINADFYQSMLGAGDEVPNWFTTARQLLLRERQVLWSRIEAAKDALLVTPHSESGTHPSLTMRAGALSQKLPILMDTQCGLDYAQTFARDFEEGVSCQFAAKLRPWFYAATMASGADSSENLKGPQILEFVCQRKQCRRAGRTELSLAQSELRLYGKRKPITIRWDEVTESTVITETSGFLSEIAVNIMAELREAPSNRTLVVQLTTGRKIVVPHWHCGENALEIEQLVNHYVGAARSRAGFPNSGSRKGSRITARGLTMAFLFVVAALVPLSLVSMSVSSNFGYKYGSAISTVLTLLVVCWVMGRRR